MSKKKRNSIVVTFLIMSIICLAAISISKRRNIEKNSSKDDSRPPLETAAMTQSNSKVEKSHQRKEKLESLKRVIKNIDKTMHESQESNNAEETVANVADEEQKHNELLRKTDPSFFTMGPSILEEMLLDEPMDRDWNISAEQSLRHALEDERVAGTQIIEINCRKTLCKATVMLTGKDKLDSFTDVWMTSGPEMESLLQTHKKMPDGQVKTSVYFSRKNEVDPFLKMREIILARLENSETPPF